MVFYVGDQIVVDILVSGVETALIDDFAAGAKTNQLGGRFTTRIVIVEESMNRRMAVSYTHLTLPTSDLV